MILRLADQQQPASHAVDLGAVVDALAAQVGRVDPAREARAGVGRDLVAMADRRRLDRERLVVGQHAQIGVGADGDCALLAASPASRAGASHIQRTTSTSVWPRARAAVHTAGSASCSPAMPPHAAAKSPTSSRLSAGVHGE